MNYIVRILVVLCIVAIFFNAGISKLGNVESIANGLKNMLNLKSFPSWIFVAIIVIVIGIELLCPVGALVSNIMKDSPFSKILNNWSIYILVGFTILATLIYHLPTNSSNLSAFLRNISIIGGLILLLR